MRLWHGGRIYSDRDRGPGTGDRTTGTGDQGPGTGCEQKTEYRRQETGGFCSPRRGSGQRLLKLAAGLYLIVTLTACGGPPADPNQSYVEKIQADRAAKDAAFRRQIDQPVPADKQNVFLPLKYFPADPEYAVPASFKAAAAKTPVQMPTSTGKIRDMELVGTLQFTLKGKRLSLGAFVEAGQAFDRLFVPFSDLTTGTETYSAGRYLEIDRNRTGIYIVDFNRAFQPFCAYNANYDCPFPPPQNRLPVPIRAGERSSDSRD